MFGVRFAVTVLVIVSMLTLRVKEVNVVLLLTFGVFHYVRVQFLKTNILHDSTPSFLHK